MNNENIPQNLDEQVLTDAQEAPAEVETSDSQIENAQEVDTQQAAEAISQSLVTGTLGYVNFDAGSSENNTTNAMVAAEYRQQFRRDSYVLITDQEQGLEFLGRVVEGPFHSPHEIGTDSAITRTTILNPDRTRFRPSYYVFGTIEVLGQLVNGRRIVSTPTRPRPYSQITIFPADRLRQLLDIEGDFLLGSLLGYEDVFVSTNVGNKNFLPRNVGVFGTVGSGKSNTTQVLIEEAIASGWAVIVVDVEGEYVKMNEPSDDVGLAGILQEQYQLAPEGIQDFRVYVPTSGTSDADAPIRFKVPISELDPFVVASILEFTEAQERMFEGLMEFARNQIRNQAGNRMGNLAPNPANNNPQVSFTLQTLINYLQLQSNNQPAGQYIATLRAGSPEITQTAPTLRSKLIRFARSGMLDWNGTNTTNYLPILDLLVGGRLSVLDVSETEDRSRNIAIAYVLQSLFDKVIETTEGDPMPNGVARPRVLVILEEVHTFVSRSSVMKMRAVLDNLQLISRRGRKRWMSLAIVSQQPGHVPDELFELANTRFIHQLKSASNLAPVKQTTGGVHEALWSTMPSLGPGQCLLTGAVFKNPLFVNIRPAKTRRLLTN